MISNCVYFGHMDRRCGVVRSHMPGFVCFNSHTVFTVFTVTKRRKDSNGGGFRQWQCSDSVSDGASDSVDSAVTAWRRWVVSLLLLIWRCA